MASVTVGQFDDVFDLLGSCASVNVLTNNLTVPSQDTNKVGDEVITGHKVAKKEVQNWIFDVDEKRRS